MHTYEIPREDGHTRVLNLCMFIMLISTWEFRCIKDWYTWTIVNDRKCPHALHACIIIANVLQRQLLHECFAHRCRAAIHSRRWHGHWYSLHGLDWPGAGGKVGAYNGHPSSIPLMLPLAIVHHCTANALLHHLEICDARAQGYVNGCSKSLWFRFYPWRYLWTAPSRKLTHLTLTHTNTAQDQVRSKPKIKWEVPALAPRSWPQLDPFPQSPDSIDEQGNFPPGSVASRGTGNIR